MKKIDINECHKLLLEIAKVFDRICTKHNIPYYMLGGTMLGAIRHNGFIPWDDDMDFGIPREHYKRFVEICNKELPSHLVFKNEDNSDYAILCIGKIVNINTELKELYSIKTTEKIGINIDIFPLDYTNSSVGPFSFNMRMRMMFKLQKLLFVDPQDRAFTKRALARVFKALLPLNKKTIPKYIEKKFSKKYRSKKNNMILNLAGAWGMKELVPQDYFGTPTLYQFENIQLYGVEDYDKYLTHLYSNYMQLPPEEKRHIHFDNAYIKE